MRHLLIINPNTRRALTAQLLEQLRATMDEGEPGGPPAQPAGTAPDSPLMGATAPFGADYIASETSYVVAAHAVVDAWHQHVLEHGRPRAVLVACFGDPGVWALRETAGVPVMGLAEAAMREADAQGPFGIVTGGKAWGPMLERLARGLQLGGPAHLRRVHTVEASGGELAADPDAGARLLDQACQQLLADEAQASASMPGMAPLRSIILGGAALGGWHTRLTASPGVALVDSVAAGARWLKRQA